MDLGKTSCRAALWAGAARTDAEGAGAPGLAAADGAVLAEASVLAVAAPLLRTAGLTQVNTACVGAAGAFAAPRTAHELAERLCASLPAPMVAITSDAVASHAGVLAGGPGVVLAAGTGAVAVAVGADGAMHRVDGWGAWLGDEGGGAWLGLHGLRAALRAADGRGPATALQAAAAARFGPLPGLAGLLEGHANPARLAASFAGDVAQAGRGGDAVAAGLLQQAGAALAGTVQAAASRLPGGSPVRTAIVGGLLELGPALTGPLFEALRHGARALDLVPAVGTALDGARLLAVCAHTIHERSVVRVNCPGRSSSSKA